MTFVHAGLGRDVIMILNQNSYIKSGKIQKQNNMYNYMYKHSVWQLHSPDHMFLLLYKLHFCRFPPVRKQGKKLLTKDRMVHLNQNRVELFNYDKQMSARLIKHCYVYYFNFTFQILPLCTWCRCKQKTRFIVRADTTNVNIFRKYLLWGYNCLCFLCNSVL